MNVLTHFEIPVDDVDKAKEFYSNLFDWEFNYMEEMKYLMFNTESEDGKTKLSGGIFKKPNESFKVTNYFSVKNLDESAKKVEVLGGKIVVPKTPVPGMGWFVHFTDIDGNLLALWENDSKAK
jgi:predicted enzyme related to lactoylglutathione lyase